MSKESDTVEKIPGNSLITDTPEEGRILAIKMSRATIKSIQSNMDILKSKREDYATNPDSLIAAASVVAIEFQTIAAANNYWKK